MNFISTRRKNRKRRKTHQGNLDQETEVVSNARLAPSANRALLRKISRKGKLLIAQSPKPRKLQENKTRCRLETEGPRKGTSNPRVNQVELGLILGILGKAT